MSSLQELYQLDLKLADLGRRMSISGFAFDTARALPCREHLVKLEQEAQERADKAAGTPLNLHSPKQLQEVFIKKLHAPVLKKSEKTDAPSLDSEVIQQYAAFASQEIRELAGALLAYRRASKLRGTYVDVLIEGARRDGRVHCSWNAYGTLSGRFSADSPNLMTMPRKNHDLTTAVEPGGIRALFTAKPGCKLVCFDCEQLEARIAAYFSGDPAMIAACEGSDFHAANAERLFPKDFKASEYAELKGTAVLSPEALKRYAFLKTLRDDAKQAGFATNYLAEAPTLLGRLIAEGRKATLQQAEALLSVVRRTFHKYYAFQAAELRKIAACGYVYSPVCRRRRFVGREPIPTECANFPIQSGAADFVNLRTLELDAALQAQFPDVAVVAQVHDSLSLEVPEGSIAAVAALCKEIFEAPFEIAGRTAVFPVEIKVSEKWS